MKQVLTLIGVFTVIVVGLYSITFVGSMLSIYLPRVLSYGGRAITDLPKKIMKDVFDPVPATYHQSGTPSKLYSKTKDGIQVTAKLGADSMNSLGYLMISLKSDALVAKPTRQNLPLNVAIVVDRSGSMSGQKLDSVKEALENVSSLFTPRDQVALVVYDDKVQTLYNGAFDRQSFERAVVGIESGGSTFLEGGLREGLRNVERSMTSSIDGPWMYESITPKQKTLDHLILLSDGLANVGLDSPSELAAVVEQYEQRGVTVSTIGVGSDYDENIMTAIGRAGRGRYYFMESPSQAMNIFDEELTALGNVAARDIEVTVKLHDGFELKRGIGYDLQGKQTFSPHNLPAGRELQYVFELASLRTDSSETQLGTVLVSYTNTRNGKRETLELPLQVTRTSAEVNPLSDDEVYEEFMRSRVAEQLWQVDDYLDEVKNDDARKVLDNVQSDLEHAAQRLPQAFSDDLQNTEEKKIFLEAQGTRDVQLSPLGRSFKKLNQSESYSVQYNR